MTSGIVRRAKAARLFGVGLVLAGLVPVLLFVSRALLPAVKGEGVLSVLPEFPYKVALVPHPLQGDIVFAIAGLAIMWLGATIAARQRAVFEAEQRRTEDRLRRVQQYYDSTRIEPYIGSAIDIEDDTEPR